MGDYDPIYTGEKINPNLAGKMWARSVYYIYCYLWYFTDLVRKIAIIIIVQCNSIRTRILYVTMEFIYMLYKYIYTEKKEIA